MICFFLIWNSSCAYYETVFHNRNSVSYIVFCVSAQLQAATIIEPYDGLTWNLVVGKSSNGPHSQAEKMNKVRSPIPKGHFLYQNFKQSPCSNRTMDWLETCYVGRSPNNPQGQGHRSRSLQGQGHYRVSLFEISCASCVHIACQIFTKLGMVLVYIIAIHLHDLKVKVIPGSRSLFSCFV